MSNKAPLKGGDSLPTETLIDALGRHLAELHGAPVSLIETHISWVLLAGDWAYKLKKPVQLDFLDFHTLALRQQACGEEWRLNRRLAPSIYLAVVAVRGRVTAPTLQGDSAVIEWAVKMRRFPAGALLNERLAQHTLEPAALDQLAARIAAFHHQADRAEPGSAWGSAARVADQAWQALQGMEAHGDAAACAGLRPWLTAQVETLHPVWAARQAAGWVREGHGDLHLANTFQWGDEVTAFDCIEFNPALRWIDVLSDAGFLVMDLQAHGRSDLAFRFLNQYLEHTGDYAGLPVLRFYRVYRALVRAQVALIRQAQAQAQALPRAETDTRRTPAESPPAARDYLSLASQLIAPPRARLLITFGLPGSGKTHLTQALLERGDAIRIRSDVERKRLFGLSPLADSRHQTGLDVYGPDATERTYTRLRELATTSLLAGYPTFIDAAFLRHSERALFQQLAQELGVPFTILECRASLDTLRERVRRRSVRRDDASEADVAVLETLADIAEPLSELGERPHTLAVDTDQTATVTELAARWLSTQPLRRGLMSRPEPLGEQPP